MRPAPMSGETHRRGSRDRDVRHTLLIRMSRPRMDPGLQEELGEGSGITAAARTGQRVYSRANASTSRMTMATTNPIIVEVSVAL